MPITRENMLYFEKKWQSIKKMKNSTNPVFTGIWKDLRIYERTYKSAIRLPRQDLPGMMKSLKLSYKSRK